ncbi:uncharacterized protein LOC112202987 [Rosa chinensis]|uniref:uncharacterized protein LOC112202987 n=1 Tax=Rosa chinensis TaxID=74649 RepID=UPI000D08E9D0|nr:uncharacterized protein LOC112202987 [Rosa chinensis]
MNLNNIQMLTGSNFKAWKSGVEFYLMMHDNMDLCFTDIEPYGVDATSSSDDKKYYRDWHRSNYRAKNVMRTTMSDTVRGSIEEPVLAVDYMEAIAEKFKESNKAEAARLSKEMNELKYTGSGGVRQHILKLTELNTRLRDLDLGVKDDQLVHNALDSLPPSFNTLRTSNNAQKESWTLNELIAICVDEESRMKKEKQPSTSVNLVEKPKK